MFSSTCVIGVTGFCSHNFLPSSYFILISFLSRTTARFHPHDWSCELTRRDDITAPATRAPLLGGQRVRWSYEITDESNRVLRSTAIRIDRDFSLVKISRDWPRSGCWSHGSGRIDGRGKSRGADDTFVRDEIRKRRVVTRTRRCPHYETRGAAQQQTGNRLYDTAIRAGAATTAAVTVVVGRDPSFSTPRA